MHVSENIREDKKLKPLYIMPCLCVKNKEWGNLTQHQILEYLTKKLHITTNATGLAKNKLISRSDPRESSKTMGIVGVALIFGMFGLMFLSDIPPLILHIRATFTGRPDLIRQLERKALKKNAKKQIKRNKPKHATDTKGVK